MSKSRFAAYIIIAYLLVWWGSKLIYEILHQ